MKKTKTGVSVTAAALLALMSATGTLAVTQEPQLSLGPSVDRIFLPSLHSWKAVSRQSLILWTSPSRPYLLQLQGPVIGLRFAEHVGIKSTGSSLNARFDSIIVDGFPYPITSITPLTKGQAKAL